MAIIADSHLHSYFSGDSNTPMTEIIESAIQKGLKIITFTEHMDYDFPISEQDPPGHFEVNTDSYLYELLKNRSKYEDKIKILFGIELGLQPSCVRKNIMLQKSHEFDFIIGSAHLCHGKDPYYKDFYEGRTEHEAFVEYFNSVIENINAFHYFDVLGHLDYISRYCPSKGADYHYVDYADLLDEILRLLISNEKGIELNTSNLWRGYSEPNPSVDIIRRYKELGGEIITIGSDSHNVSNVGACFDTARDILINVGFKYYCIFENRLPEYKVL